MKTTYNKETDMFLIENNKDEIIGKLNGAQAISFADFVANIYAGQDFAVTQQIDATRCNDIMLRHSGE